MTLFDPQNDLLIIFQEGVSTEFGRGIDNSNRWFVRNFFLAYPKVNALLSEC
jgi:hypothetical protein